MNETKSVENASRDVAKKKEYRNNLSVKLKMIATNITVEPLLICAILPNLMTVMTTHNLTLEKSCRVNLAFEDRICNALSIRNRSYPDYQTYEDAVQISVANLAIWRNLTLSIIPAILLPFLGAWSDRHKKRKPVFLNPILGEVVISILMLVCVYFFHELPAQVNIVAESIPLAFCGGLFAMFMGLYSYISGITTVETRTIRIGVIQTTFTVSFCIGMVLSGILFENMGFYGKFFFP